jgi:hypothetical protein
MDISADPHKSERTQTGPFPYALYRTVLGIFRRLAGIFTLTKEDRLQAGVHLGGEGRDG